MENDKIGERVAKLETITENHERLLTAQSEKNETLAKLTTLMEINSKRDEQRDEQLKEFGDTLKSVNDNLTHLNKSQEKIQQDISTISSRVEKVEKIQDEEKQRYVLDLRGLPKKTILKVVAIGIAAITAVVTAWVKLKIGIK